MTTHATTGELAKELGEPVWIVRRAVDAVGGDVLRAGLYRLVPRSLIPRIIADIAGRRKRAERVEEATAC